MALQGKDLRKLVVREVIASRCRKSAERAGRTHSPIFSATKIPPSSWKWATPRFEILTKYDLMSTVASLMEPKR